MHFYYFSEKLVTKLSVSSATYVTWQTAILKEAVVLRLTLFACAMVFVYFAENITKTSATNLRKNEKFWSNRPSFKKAVFLP